MKTFKNDSMPCTIEGLVWDSTFFNYKVCRINGVISDRNQLSDILDELKKLDVDLTYYSSPVSLDYDLNFSQFYTIKPVDKKITYLKKAIGNHPFNECVTEFKGAYPDSTLIKLALESGIYSRFYIDKKIGKSKYEALYKEWIINSVNKKLAKAVLIYLDKEVTAGFVTLGEKNARADIGIISVNRIYRGKGIGKALMLSGEKWFLNNNFNLIQVVTQGENLPARRLYESCGYELHKEEFVYHLWKK